ncbi:MAG: peptide chain release factor N(5)-glutamine methyltransferase [Paraprevotella sp.]|nr:peptide chain release factor N(5)-glutamine methyltransferase [Paraprevotella sp.]
MQKEYSHTYRILSAHYPTSEAQALARWVMEVRFGMNRLDLCLGKDRPLTEEERIELESIISRLLKDEPIQYILKHADFCGNTLHVGPGVLIPRPETEELVHWILSDIPDRPLRIADIGTGSGCIAISLATARPDCRISAIDISRQALDIAEQNAHLAHAENIEFIRCDILDSQTWPRIPTATWDIIVSNPPYVLQSETRDMTANVLNYEPATALFVPDEDPLIFYRTIARYAQTYLKPNGRLCFEINRRFGKEVTELLAASGFSQIELRKDFRENDRMIRCLR